MELTISHGGVAQDTGQRRSEWTNTIQGGSFQPATSLSLRYEIDCKYIPCRSK